MRLENPLTHEKAKAKPFAKMKKGQKILRLIFLCHVRNRNLFAVKMKRESENPPTDIFMSREKSKPFAVLFPKCDRLVLFPKMKRRLENPPTDIFMSHEKSKPFCR